MSENTKPAQQPPFVGASCSAWWLDGWRRAWTEPRSLSRIANMQRIRERHAKAWARHWEGRIEEIPCPDCYGGHFRPCQMCGDSGVAWREKSPNAQASATEGCP